LSQDRRRFDRYLVNWRVALIYEDQNLNTHTYYGRAIEVSEGGLSLLLDYNFIINDTITVLLEAPPLNNKTKHSLIEIHSQMVYTIYSGQYQSFKSGIKFLQFKGQGRQVLKRRLNSMIHNNLGNHYGREDTKD
jgi:hypothetical protein